ncbi:malate synthase G [Sphaeroforma arctica JP610]|uniref:Malate synthase G n=1 Tax=Sphaeroforma arctica JP610 TaxID=667725 RepID=A0A0L0FH52_9EUKA|nr:malate synthase G [Sphaeroforma arctica JP610]KNC76065.1 malate synthase G [Sphaeroforma arctica JP610]|eukprot:XP_014149967.1 malate synthase G [Sphaeroforma arctica JP610]
MLRHKVCRGIFGISQGSIATYSPTCPQLLHSNLAIKSLYPKRSAQTRQFSHTTTNKMTLQDPKGDYVNVASLRVNRGLYQFVENEVAPNTGVDVAHFWECLSNVVSKMAPRNEELLKKRDSLQKQIDEWHLARKGQEYDAAEYKQYLMDIGYLLPEGEAFKVTTSNVDPEIASIAGPQLVVPINNARYALNACNGRWQSLFDGLYGTNAVSETGGAQKAGGFNPRRALKVFEWVDNLLDEVMPLADGASWAQTKAFSVESEKLCIELTDGKKVAPKEDSVFAGYLGDAAKPTSVLIKNNNLHMELKFNADGAVGAEHHAHINDIQIESAITAIMDCEDSVTAVDAEDKVAVYKNWTGLMRGTLSASFQKGGKTLERVQNSDRVFKSPGGSEDVSLKGRSLLLVRNVGMHMYTDAVTTAGGDDIPEGFLDAFVTILAAIHDVKGNGKYANSVNGSVYIVKPKQHGPEEVAFTCELFTAVEQALDLPKNTVKIGVMDEERRTTINLYECIREAKERIVFINTGFLDRMGDEIHTSIEAGPVVALKNLRKVKWLPAYEAWNVDCGIAAGLVGTAQIGKGMWAAPDSMAEMLEQKIGHLKQGANTSWVPSPIAASLHVTHYHRVNVQETQEALKSRLRAPLDDILTPPLTDRADLNPEDVQKDLEAMAQSILGYVVRWIDMGVGCSKVPDIHNIGLMEDRATLRISSQHLANWLHHEIITKDQIKSAFEKMAAVVDEQNSSDPAYKAMVGTFEDNIAFQGALQLVFKGREVSNGYTEPVLHASRRKYKATNRN